MSAVDTYLAALDHPFRSFVEQVRGELLASSDAVHERIKWNAPSFGYGDADRVTFRLRPAPTCQLILHRGAAKIAEALDFADPAGLLAWKSPDRAVISFASPEVAASRLDEVVDTAVRWLHATA